MNEELLRGIWTEIGGETNGSFTDFLAEFKKDSGVRLLVYDFLGGAKTGTEEEFYAELGWSPEQATPPTTPPVTPPKTGTSSRNKAEQSQVVDWDAGTTTLPEPSKAKPKGTLRLGEEEVVVPSGQTNVDWGTGTVTHEDVKESMFIPDKLEGVRTLLGGVKKEEEEVNSVFNNLKRFATNVAGGISTVVAMQGTNDVISNFGVGYKAKNQVNKYEYDQAMRRVDLLRIDAFDKVDPDMGIPAVDLENIYDNKVVAEGIKAETRSILTKTMNTADEHMRDLSLYYQYTQSKLTPEDQELVANFKNLPQDYFQNNPASPELRAFMVAGQNVEKQREYNGYVNKYGDLLNDLTKSTLDARSKGLKGDQVRQAADEVFDKYIADSPLDRASIEKMRENYLKVSGIAEKSIGIPGAEQTQSTGYKVLKTIDALGSSTFNSLYALLGVNAVSDNIDTKVIEDMNVEAANRAVRDLIVNNPDDNATADFYETTVKVPGVGTLIIGDGDEATGIRDKKGNKIYYLTDEHKKLIESYNNDPSKYRGEKDANVSKDVNWRAALKQVSQIGLDMVPMVVGAAFTGGGTAGMVTGAFIMSYSDFNQRGLDDGLNPPQAMLYGMLSSSIQGYVEAKVGKAEAILGRAFTTGERAALSEAIHAFSTQEARNGVVRSTLERGYMTRFNAFVKAGRPGLKEVPIEVLQEISNEPVDMLVSSLFGVEAEAPTKAEITNTVALTTLLTIGMAGLGGALGAKREYNRQFLAAAVNSPEEFAQIGATWVQDARDKGNEEEAVRREKEMADKTIMIDVMSKYHTYIKEEDAMSSEDKDKVMDLAEQLAYLEYNKNKLTSEIKIQKVEGEIQAVRNAMNDLIHKERTVESAPIVEVDTKTADEEGSKLRKGSYDKRGRDWYFTDAEGNGGQVTDKDELKEIKDKFDVLAGKKTEAEVKAERAKTADAAKKVTKKAYDFDGTLLDNETGQLTELGQEVKERIAAGEDITIVTARKDSDTQQIKDVLATDKVVGVGSEKNKGDVLDKLGIDRKDYHDADTDKMNAINGETALDQAEVFDYIADLTVKTEAQERVTGIKEKMNNAEYVSVAEIDKAVTPLYEMWDRVDSNEGMTDKQKESAKFYLENEISNLENYELRTKNEAGTTTKTETVRTTKLGAPKETKIPSKYTPTAERFNGQETTVTDEAGNKAEGTFRSEDGALFVDTKDGSTEVTSDYTFEGSTFDDAGNVTGAVLDMGGKKIEVKDADLALDLALVAKIEEVGAVTEAEFVDAYEQVTTTTTVEPIMVDNQTPKIETKKEVKAKAVTNVLENYVPEGTKLSPKTYTKNDDGTWVATVTNKDGKERKVKVTEPKLVKKLNTELNNLNKTTNEEEGSKEVNKERGTKKGKVDTTLDQKQGEEEITTTGATSQESVPTDTLKNFRVNKADGTPVKNSKDYTRDGNGNWTATVTNKKGTVKQEVTTKHIIEQLNKELENENKRRAGKVTRGDEQTGNRGGRDSSGGNQTLEGAPVIRDATGPIKEIVEIAEKYAADNGIPFNKQGEYVEVDTERGERIAEAYENMKHDPQDPKVKAAYKDLIEQVTKQYQALVDGGYKFWFFDGDTDPYKGNPWNAMRDLRENKSMGVYASDAGFGSGDTALDVSNSPLLADTGIEWGVGSPDGAKKKVLANDLFRAVHDALGHGMEGAGFRARGEENAWQAHVKLFTGPAVGAMTSETRGQNSWLNFGPHGESNRTAKVDETVFADQKTGLMPEWTWTEGVAKSEPATAKAKTKPDTKATKDTKVAKGAEETILEPIGDSEKAIVGQIYKFFTSRIPGLSTKQAREFAQVNYNMWNAVASTLGKVDGLKYIREKVSMMGSMPSELDAIRVAKNTRGKLRFQIVGERGAAALDLAQEVSTRLDNLKTAKEMDVAGKDAKIIKVATGWEKGAEGKWRYETPPLKLKVKSQTDIDNLINKTEATMGGFHGANLGDILNLEDFAKAYGIEYQGHTFNSIGGITVFFDRSVPLGEAYYSNNAIHINPMSATYNEDYSKDGALNNFRGILLHEVQHHISSQEGFARPFSEEAFSKELDNEIEEGRDNLKKAKSIASFEPSYADRVALIEDRVKALEKIKDELTDKQLDDIYWRSSGEVEARNIQHRMDMTPGQRSESLLSETEDVAREDQIKLTGGFDNLIENIKEANNSVDNATQIVDNTIDHLKKAVTIEISNLRAEKDKGKKEALRGSIKDKKDAIKRLQGTKKDIKFQEEGGYRGVAIALANGSSIIASLESPSPTTLAHEGIFHAMIEESMTRDEKQVFIDEYNDNFAATESDKATFWSYDVSEYTARVYEKYLGNGRKLTEQEVKDTGRRKTLQDAFDKFTELIKGFYNGIIEYNNSKGVTKEIKVSQQAQDFFDRVTGIDKDINKGATTAQEVAQGTDGTQGTETTDTTEATASREATAQESLNEELVEGKDPAEMSLDETTALLEYAARMKIDIPLLKKKC